MKRISPKRLDAELTIGADPEFLVLDQSKKAVCANAYTGSGARCSFGADGGGLAFEIRPVPSTVPKFVVDSIQKSLRSGARRFPGLLINEWKAGGSSVHPIGGHIHIGTRPYQSSMPTVPWRTSNDIPRSVSEALDRYLAVPLLYVEDPDEARSRRVGSGYGNLNDWREQPWGMEYRTPGSWITSPEVSLAALSLAKVVVVESITGRITDEDLFTISRRKFKTDRLGPRMIVKAWKRIKTMALYKKYAKDISILENLYKNGLFWNSGDIKDTWKVITPRLKAKLDQKAAAAAAVEAAKNKLSAIWINPRPRLYTVTRRRL